MTRRERLLCTLQGRTVDRPPVSFYEIDGSQDTANPDPFNIFHSPDWEPVIKFAREKSDRMVSCWITMEYPADDPLQALSTESNWEDPNGSMYFIKTIKVGDRLLTNRTRRDRNVNTFWTEEHYLKDEGDIKAFLALPPRLEPIKPDVSKFLSLERSIGESGILILETPDPLCMAAELFSMDTYMIMAMTETKLFRNLLDRMFQELLIRIELTAQALPGRLWRIYGPEYAAPPYLPPEMFKKYVTAYDKELVKIIQKSGGYVRLHAHGNIRDILDDIVLTGCDGLDPIEPPPQGDVKLREVRAWYGDRLVLFGNLEACDLENLNTREFEKKIVTALEEGTGGRGFVLMPSSGPYGRKLNPRVLENYQAMVRLAEGFTR